MKKEFILVIVCTVIGFFFGVLSGWGGCESAHRLDKANLNTIPYKIEVIKAQKATIDAAWKVIDKNNLLDTDGGDEMGEFLRLSCQVDSLYKLEN